MGDGDSKSYSDVVAHDPYHGKEVKKLECVGHIQKRLGARLRKLKSTNKSALADGKSIGGKERLTDKMINKLQNYFGIAARKSKGKIVYELKKAIGAVLFHCLNLDNVSFWIYQYFWTEQYLFLYFKNITFYVRCFVQKW